MRTTLKRINPVDEWAVETVVTHPVFDELFEQIVGDLPDGAPGTAVSPGRRPRQHPGRRVLLAGVAAVVVALGTLAGTGEIGGGGGLGRPFTTQWHAGQALEVGRSARGAGTWRLVDDLLSGTWQQNDYGPPPGYLTCATADRCYVMVGKYPSAMAGAPLLSESLYVTTDQGADWTVLPMPSGFDPSTALSSAGGTWCAAGGTYQDQPVFLTTADGGHSFRVTPLSGGVGSLHTLSCPAAGSCDGLASSATGSDTGALDATFLTVTADGATFRDHPILSGDSMVALACTSIDQCTVVGQTDTSESTFIIPAGVAAVTSDAGASWTAGSVPTGFGIKGFSRLACTDAAHCIVTGQVAIKDAEQCGTTSPGTGAGATGPSLASIGMAPAVHAISETESAIAATWARKTHGFGGGGYCSGAATSEISVVATSSDAGRSWTPEALPNDVPTPQLDGLACPSATRCWVSGSESIPQKVGSSIDYRSPVLLGTTNGGATWSKVTFSVSATAPNPTGQSYLTIGAISCPSANVCLAKGSGAQGANVGTVYSLVVPPG